MLCARLNTCKHLQAHSSQSTHSRVHARDARALAGLVSAPDRSMCTCAPVPGHACTCSIACVPLHLQIHAGKLRDLQVETLQVAMEQEYHQLQRVYEERRQMTAGNLSTSSSRTKETGHKKKLRKLLAMWEYWQGVGGGAVVQASLDEIQAGRFPWQPSEDPTDVSERSLRFQLFKATSEFVRSSEECDFLLHDCCVSRAYYLYQLDVILGWVLSAHQRTQRTLSQGMAYLLAFYVRRLLSLLHDATQTQASIRAGRQVLRANHLLLKPEPPAAPAAPAPTAPAVPS